MGNIPYFSSTSTSIYNYKIMELIERAGFLTLLQSKFDAVDGEGHCILVSGEAGIGKTSLIRAFCKEHKEDVHIFQGTCDALFTPRPLAPLYDILWQMGSEIRTSGETFADRTGLFTQVLHELGGQRRRSVVVFEDVHWADEATLDFIKFLARRITRIRCLFVLTFRDDEVHAYAQLRNVLGQLPPDSFTRMQLTPLSRAAVDRMAEEKGYRGEDVYTISGGNPFYVSEILASYSLGVPVNIRDSILSVYHRMEHDVKIVWQVLSVMPTGLEMCYLEKMDASYISAIEPCLEARIMIVHNGMLRFKHELYRRTIETSLSPLLRVSLNRRVLEFFQAAFEEHRALERIIHHAKNANEYDVVISYAPPAARQASALGSHTEAAKLYLTAIEYYQGNDKDRLLEFYEPYAYECYLTSRLKEAIVYQGKALRIRAERDDVEKLGDCMRFLSRIWWFSGNRKQAEHYGLQALHVFRDQPASRAKAMALSNMSQLMMLAYRPLECAQWGEEAIAMSRDLGDEETLAHALNNVGTIKMQVPSSREEGMAILRQSLEIAQRNGLDEHVARAYTNLGATSVDVKDYPLAKESLDTGLQYCEEKDLQSWLSYMTAVKARLLCETGAWEEACRLSGALLKNEHQASIVKIGALAVMARVRMRRGEPDVLPLLVEARDKAFETMELQRIIPALTAALEYEWLTGKVVVALEDIETTIRLIAGAGNVHESSGFAFWLYRSRMRWIDLPGRLEGYIVDGSTPLTPDTAGTPHTPQTPDTAAAVWQRLGCPYEQALMLFEGAEEEKVKALAMMKKLGANAVHEKLKRQMRSAGIQRIPRGVRKSTQANPALLTDREIGVLQLLKDGMHNKEIAAKLFISAKTVDHHISSILFKLEVSSRGKAVQEAKTLGILK